MDVRKLYDKPYIYHYDLEGRDVTLTIERIVAGTLVGTSGKASKKPILYFKGTEKGYALPITMAKVIQQMYGTFDLDKWIGKKITLYPSTTQMGGQTVECIRIRPTIPKGKGEAIRPDVPPPAETAMVTADEIAFAPEGGETA